MNILVTGAAGYIGSVVAEELVGEGHRVIALDNLQQGHRQALAPEAAFVGGDLASREDLDGVFRAHRIEAVVHLAADSLVEASVRDPARYFRSNVANGLNLLSAMLEHGVGRIVFSSTAAVYGEPESVPIGESHPERPVNPYGESKLMFERILARFREAYGMSYISLRYFNAAGASRRCGEDHRPETHLIPRIFRVALGEDESIPVFGTDYDTPDGTCVRDYIHVLDIARAHTLALKAMDGIGGRIFNLGSSRGYSVTEVIQAAREITGADITVQKMARRPGDPARLVASYARIQSELGWEPAGSDLGSIIGSAWEWQKRHPRGYQD